MSPAAPSVIRATTKQAMGGALMVLGLLAVSLSLFYWANAPVSEYVVPVAAAGCALFAVGAIIWLLADRAYKHLVLVVDTQTIEEHEKPLEGKLVATLVEDPLDPSRLVGPSGVRLSVSQWDMIYNASKAAGWKFSRPLIEKAVKETGIKITGLNDKYTSLYTWMLEVGIIKNTKPTAKNPAYRLTPKGVRIVEGFAGGVEYVGGSGEV